jgi:hypothetical protein
LGHITAFPDTSPFVIGIYFGNSKPQSAVNFLMDFVIEAKSLCSTGLLLEQGTVKVKLHSLICDAPARSYILNVKGHTGYFGCGKCTQEGSSHKRRVVFSASRGNLRTDSGFRELAQEEHHLGGTIFSELPINLVTQVPFEYMHLVCLGVTRKLINLWLKGEVSRFRLSSKEVFTISAGLIKCKPFFPSEFSRKPRSLQFIATWKATEL